MKSIILYLKKLDWALIAISILLVVIGLISLYSSSMARGDLSNFKKQIIFFAIGFSLMIGLSFFDYRILKENSYLILLLYFLSLISLAGLLIFAPEIRGVKGWYKIGSFSFDPIEPAKIILILLLAKYFSKRHTEVYKIRHILLSGFYVFIPVSLIFFQPDFGSAFLLFLSWIGVLLISGIKMRHFLILSLCAILLLGLSWSYLLRDYQKDRILSFVFPQRDPNGGSWSQTQAKIAIGSGGVLGEGIGNGSQVRYGFLPEPQTDFITAAIAEETGIVGIGILLFLFALLLWRILKIALKSTSNFSRLFASGTAIILFSQIVIHMSVNLGFLPVIGLSLPLVSYGGSGMIFTFISFGILESIKTH